MIWNFWNPSAFAHETANIKLAYFQSVVSWAKNDGFEKFKIMVFSLEPTMENDEKRHWFLLVLYDLEKIGGYILSMN